MKKWMFLAMTTAMVSIMFVGCGKPEMPNAPLDLSSVPDEQESVETETVALWCGTCGAAKGSESCCVEGAEKCEKCNMTAGSALCCKLEGDFAGKELCGKCGQVAGSENCCAEDAERCEKCSMIAGSPLCCKLADADQGHDHEHGDGDGHDHDHGDEHTDGDSDK